MSDKYDFSLTGDEKLDEVENMLRADGWKYSHTEVNAEKTKLRIWRQGYRWLSVEEFGEGMIEISEMRLGLPRRRPSHNRGRKKLRRL